MVAAVDGWRYELGESACQGIRMAGHVEIGTAPGWPCGDWPCGDWHTSRLPLRHWAPLGATAPPGLHSPLCIWLPLSTGHLLASTAPSDHAPFPFHSACATPRAVPGRLAGLDRTTSAFLDALAPFAQSGCNSWAHAAAALGVNFDELPHLPPRYPDLPTPSAHAQQPTASMAATVSTEAQDSEPVVGAACVPDTSGSVRFTLRVAQRLAAVEVG